MQGVDPVGACVGPRGSRVRMVVSELRGEKIDIIPWNTEPARFVAKALSPARVREVYIDDDTHEATVIVPDDQLALAIGKEGLNARLAARLTGLEGRHQVRLRVRAGGGRCGLRRRGQRDFIGRCCGDPLERQALPELGAPRLAFLRRPGTPGARCEAKRPARTSPTESSSSAAPMGRPEADDDEAPTERPTSSTATDGRRGASDADSGPRRSPFGRVTTPRERHSPIRSCVGCGRRAPQGDLRRLVARDGALVPGHARRPGKGAYTCRRLQCYERAVERNAFARTLKAPCDDRTRTGPALH